MACHMRAECQFHKQGLIWQAKVYSGDMSLQQKQKVHDNVHMQTAFGTAQLQNGQTSKTTGRLMMTIALKVSAATDTLMAKWSWQSN